MKSLPMGRAGRPEEIGAMVAVLASAISSYTAERLSQSTAVLPIAERASKILA